VTTDTDKILRTIAEIIAREYYSDDWEFLSLKTRNHSISEFQQILRDHTCVGEMVEVLVAVASKRSKEPPGWKDLQREARRLFTKITGQPWLPSFEDMRGILAKLEKGVR